MFKIYKLLTIRGKERVEDYINPYCPYPAGKRNKMPIPIEAIKIIIKSLDFRISKWFANYNKYISSAKMWQKNYV